MNNYEKKCWHTNYIYFVMVYKIIVSLILIDNLVVFKYHMINLNNLA